MLGRAEELEVSLGTDARPEENTTKLVTVEQYERSVLSLSASARLRDGKRRDGEDVACLLIDVTVDRAPSESGVLRLGSVDARLRVDLFSSGCRPVKQKKKRSVQYSSLSRRLLDPATRE